MLFVILFQVVKRDHGVIIVHQDALSRAFQVIELPALDRPQHTYCA
jgi:hypothetical protein